MRKPAARLAERIPLLSAARTVSRYRPAASARPRRRPPKRTRLVPAAAVRVNVPTGSQNVQLRWSRLADVGRRHAPATRRPALARLTANVTTATSNSTEPHIRLLGGFSVAGGDNVVSDRAWRLRKQRRRAPHFQTGKAAQ
ncbi:MAG TPA: hypothetical protein VF066_07610 [Thermoleophilaceae bacterium]